MSEENEEGLSAARLPQPHRMVIRPRGEGVPIGAERHAGHLVFMSAENEECLSAARPHSRTVWSEDPEARVCPSG